MLIHLVLDVKLYLILTLANIPRFAVITLVNALCILFKVDIMLNIHSMVKWQLKEYKNDIKQQNSEWLALYDEKLPFFDEVMAEIQECRNRRNIWRKVNHV